jgi:hypothetical protein
MLLLTGPAILRREQKMTTMAFREEQKIAKNWWATLLIVALAALIWYSFIQQIILGHPFGNNPGPNWMIWLFLPLFGIAFPVVWYMTTLIVEVHSDHVLIRYYPFLTRKIPLEDIKHYQARTYKPIREYGGWGVRGWGRRRAYNVSGNKGVELELQDGRHIMIGSQKPAELVLALDATIQS